MTPSVPAPGEAAPAPAKGGGDGGPTGAFSRLLSALGATAQGVQEGVPGKTSLSETGDTAPEGESGTEAVSGVPLPGVAGTGKILPADAEALPGTAETAAATDAALALVAPQTVPPAAAEPAAKPGQAPAPTPTPAPQLPAGLPLPAQAEGEGAKPAPQPAVAIQVAPQPVSRDGTASERDPALAAEKPATDFAAKLQPAGASGDREAQRDPARGDRPAAEPAAKPSGKIAAEPASIQPPAPVQTTPVGAAVPAASAVADPVPSSTAAKPAIETGIARELSRIVDSLASAREALTAKGATLAIDHAEFGELSLRFDQRRDGQLAVQLAATDPETHRAVAAAIADRPAFAQADSGSSSGQQNAQAGGNASARGSLADREGGSAEGNAPREERQGERRRADSDTTGKGPRGDSSAIYA